MPTWNEMPFDESALPEEKAHEFDLQMRENGGPTPAELEQQAQEGPKK